MVESTPQKKDCDLAYANHLKTLDKKLAALFPQLAASKTPTPILSKVADAVAILLSKKKSWIETSKMLKDKNFTTWLANLDITKVTTQQISGLETLKKAPEYSDPAAAKKISSSAFWLMQWCRLVDQCFKDHHAAPAKVVD